MTATSGALGDVCCLWSFLAFGDFELYRVAFLQALVAFGSDRAVMYKNVGTIGAPDEPVAFCVIEPFYGAFQTFHVPPLSARLSSGGPRRAHIGCILERLGLECQDETVGQNRISLEAAPSKVRGL